MTAENPIPGVSWISTPTRKRSTDNPVDKPADKPAPASPDSKKTEPPKKPLVQRLIRTLAARIILGGLIVTGAGYAGIKVYENVPASHQNAETASPFDNGKLDTQRQTVVLGQNAQIATPEDKNDLISSFVPEPKSINDVPTISVLPSIDLQKAGRVEAWRTPSPFGPIPEYLHFSIENSGTPLGLFLPEGIQTKKVEIFKMSNGMYMEKFNLGNNRYMLMGIDLVGLTPTDAIKEATPINGDDFIKEASIKEGLELDINKDPSIFTTNKKGSEITMFIAYINGPQGFIQPATPVIRNGNLLFSSPR